MPEDKNVPKLCPAVPSRLITIESSLSPLWPNFLAMTPESMAPRLLSVFFTNLLMVMVETFFSITGLLSCISFTSNTSSRSWFCSDELNTSSLLSNSGLYKILDRSMFLAFQCSIALFLVISSDLPIRSSNFSIPSSDIISLTSSATRKK